jgi:thioredoxin-like negative regulator of GroEL
MQQCKVKAMPTFKAFKNGAEIGSMEGGSNVDKLKAFIESNM